MQFAIFGSTYRLAFKILNCDPKIRSDPKIRATRQPRRGLTLYRDPSGKRDVVKCLLAPAPRPADALAPEMKYLTKLNGFQNDSSALYKLNDR